MAEQVRLLSRRPGRHIPPPGCAALQDLAHGRSIEGDVKHGAPGCLWCRGIIKIVRLSILTQTDPAIIRWRKWINRDPRLLPLIPQERRYSGHGDTHTWRQEPPFVHRSLYITNASTYPRVGCRNASGKRPTISKPSDCQSRTARSLVLTTKLNCIAR